MRDQELLHTLTRILGLSQPLDPVESELLLSGLSLIAERLSNATEDPGHRG
jgi:hypothetical protein